MLLAIFSFFVNPVFPDSMAGVPRLQQSYTRKNGVYLYRIFSTYPRAFAIFIDVGGKRKYPLRKVIMNKQQYLKNVSILSDPTNAFWREYDDVQLATMAMKCAEYRFKKSARAFAILATICTILLTGSTWVVMQNTMNAGVEAFIVFNVVLVSACVMIQPVTDLFHLGQVWDQTENNLKQAIWDRRNK